MSSHKILQSVTKTFLNLITNEETDAYSWPLPDTQIISQTFCCGSYNVFNFSFARKKLKKNALIIGSQTFFFIGLATQTSTELIFHFISMSQDASVLFSVTLIISLQIQIVFLSWL